MRIKNLEQFADEEKRRMALTVTVFAGVCVTICFTVLVATLFETFQDPGKNIGDFLNTNQVLLGICFAEVVLLCLSLSSYYKIASYIFMVINCSSTFYFMVTAPNIESYHLSVAFFPGVNLLSCLLVGFRVAAFSSVLMSFAAAWAVLYVPNFDPNLMLSTSIAVFFAITYASLLGILFAYFSEKDAEAASRKTELIKMQNEKLTQTAKLAGIGEISASIVHEINNPIALIDLYSKRAEKFASAQDIDRVKLLDVIHIVRATIQRIIKIINSMKNLSKTQSSGSFEVININNIIEDALIVSEGRLKRDEIQLIKSIEKDLFVKGDPTQLSQVIVNLLANAYDAIELAEKKIVDLAVFREDQEIIIKVSDSGPGIPPELREKIMEPFFTTKKVGKGTGLGLSITSEILRNHGGSIYLEEKFPPTCFVVKLPIYSMEGENVTNRKTANFNS